MQTPPLIVYMGGCPPHIQMEAGGLHTHAFLISGFSNARVLARDRETEDRNKRGPASPPGGGERRQTYIHTYTYIYIYIYIYIYVRSHLYACSVAILLGSSYSVGSMATQRLPLLCRTTHNMSSDVHRLVREYLTVRVGKECARIDDLLWWQMRHKGVTLDFCVSGTIPHVIARRGRRTWALTSMQRSLRRTS